MEEVQVRVHIITVKLLMFKYGTPHIQIYGLVMTAVIRVGFGAKYINTPQYKQKRIHGLKVSEKSEKVLDSIGEEIVLQISTILYIFNL